MNEEEFMCGQEMLNGVAELIINQIRTKENYRNCFGFYEQFCEIEKDIKKARILMNNIIRVEQHQSENKEGC